MPTSLLGGVLQAALLGAKDSVTPLVAIAYSTVVNLTGDYLLVSKFHMGLKGAAIATLVAQLAGTIAMIQIVANTLLYYLHERVWNIVTWGRINMHVTKEIDT